MADENTDAQEPRELSLKRLLLAIDVPGKMLADLGTGNRIHLVTAAGIISGDIDADDDDKSFLGKLEGGFADAIEANGDRLDRDVLRLRNVRLQRTPDGPLFTFHALWINPDAVIGITYGEMSRSAE